MSDKNEQGCNRKCFLVLKVITDNTEKTHLLQFSDFLTEIEQQLQPPDASTGLYKKLTRR